MRDLNIFHKIVIVLLVLLIPILLLFQYTNRVSSKVIEQQIREANVNRITYFVSQMDNAVNQLSVISSTILGQTSIREYQRDYFESSVLHLDRQQTNRFAEEFVHQMRLSASLFPTIKVYSPSLEEYIANSGSGTFSLLDLQFRLSSEWTEILDDDETPSFVRHFVEPYASRDDISLANIVVEMSFTGEDLKPMLDEFKSSGGNDPFLFRPHFEPLYNQTPNRSVVDDLVHRLEERSLSVRGSAIIEREGKNYLVAYQKLNELEWYAVDYAPLSQVLTPIAKSQWLFYITAFLLLALTALAAVLLYRNVQVPILKLMKAVQQLKLGDFSVRVTGRSSKEFNFLFNRFNEMTEQIDTLIKNVYEEKLRSREATLKQLQSQINPHFLYNSLAFITSMAKLENTEAVIAMGLNLGNYYRYATRVEHQLVPLANELEVVENYLTIQGMRNQRLHYEINIEEDLKSLPIPRLLLQPVVENAVVHGIEPKPGIGIIIVGGTMTERRVTLWVEDNGIGMDSGKVNELYAKFRAPLTEEMGCGIWNVQQRMIYQFGEGAEIHFRALAEGGLRVELSWPHFPKQLTNAEGGQ